MRDNNLDIRIQWHQPDEVWCAVLMRDGEPWFLDGGLVGMDVSRERAVTSLIEQAEWLVIKGGNSLTEDLSLEDRIWIFEKLDYGDRHEINQKMYEELRYAGMPALGKHGPDGDPIREAYPRE